MTMWQLKLPPLAMTKRNTTQSTPSSKKTCNFSQKRQSSSKKKHSTRLRLPIDRLFKPKRRHMKLNSVLMTSKSKLNKLSTALKNLRFRRTRLKIDII